VGDIYTLTGVDQSPRMSPSATASLLDVVAPLSWFTPQM